MQIGDLVINLVDFSAAHVLPNAHEVQFATQRVSFHPQYRRARGQRSTLFTILQSFLGLGAASPVLLMAMLLFGEGRLEALEEGIGARIFGNVGEKVIWKGRKSARLDLSGRELRSDQVGRGGLGEGKDLPLRRRPAQLAVDVGHGIVKMGAVGLVGRSYQVSGR